VTLLGGFENPETDRAHHPDDVVAVRQPIEERDVGRVVYSMSVSTDGFIETPGHELDWVVVDEALRYEVADGRS
jgi:hypothetical protein